MHLRALSIGTVVCGLLAAPAFAADKVAEILQAAEQACASFENGQFAHDDAIVAVDLTGNGETDTLVDESRFSCSSAASMYCGSGGCMLHAVVGDESWRFQAEGWRMIEWHDRPILLIARDGGWCGGAGAQLCYESVTWSNGDMLTVMPPPQ